MSFVVGSAFVSAWLAKAFRTPEGITRVRQTSPWPPYLNKKNTWRGGRGVPSLRGPPGYLASEQTQFLNSKRIQVGLKANVLNDETNSYKVNFLTIPKLLDKHNITKVDYFKLDIEGAEYDLINGLKAGDLDKVDQLFLEFHLFDFLLALKN